MNFVTGGTGLVGSRLIYDLLNKGEDVLALKRENSDIETLKKLLEFWSPESNLFDKIQWVIGDVRDIYSILDPISHSDRIYHAAAVVSFHKKDAKLLEEVNVQGTANVINAALNTNVKKICHVSSTAALGRVKSGETINEKAIWKDSKLNTRYAVSKYLSENEVWRGAHEGLDVVIVNPSVVIGPGAEGKSSGKIFSHIKRGLPFYPAGANAFVSSSDVSRACIELMNSDISRERFVLAGENMEFQKLFAMISESMGKKIPTKEAKLWMLKSGRILEAFKEFFGGEKAAITKETVMTTGNSYYYDSSKITNEINFQFGSIQAAVDETVGFVDFDKTVS